MKTSVFWMSAVSLLCACGCGVEPSGNPPSAVTTTATATGPAPAAQLPSPKEAVALALRTLDKWVAAQEAGKLDDYLALYDEGSFRGITRTASGAEQKLSFAQWKEQRSRMFGTKITVMAESPTAVSWAEKPGLGAGLVEVRFTQRWKNAKYADHGPKVIQFRIDKGVAKIVYEELISSSAGWADAAQCTGDQANSELPCGLADGRWGWCKGGVCKDVCPAGHSYDPLDTQCHQLRDCKSATARDESGFSKTAKCDRCFGQHCFDPGATRSLSNQN